MTERAPNVVSFPDREAIELQAASWVVRLEEAGLSSEDQIAFERWLALSDAHRSSFERMQAYWRDAAVLQDLNDIADAVEPEQAGSSWLTRRRGVLGAAAAVAVTLVVSMMWPGAQQPALVQDYVSARGEQRTVNLPDGSVVQLNTETALSFQATADARTLRLLNGEAYFDVAHDPDRPFTVRTSAGSVEAIGTAFATRLIGRDGLEVTVAEGRVAVRPVRTGASAVAADPPAAPAGEPALSGATKAEELVAGTTALYTPEQQVVTAASAIEINRKLAWRDGVLVFAGEPLRTVVDDISRYTNIEIAISDKELEALPIGGYFRVGETEALFEALELTFNVRVERLGSGLVRLSKAASEKGGTGT